MHQSGHTGKLEYADNLNSKKKKKRKRNIMWFNPPFSEHVKTNIGKEFLQLLAKHFPCHHPLHKICNKFNVKVSYSCMPNMAVIISRHNKIMLSNKTTANRTTPPCNCRNKVSCLLEEKCCKSSIVYKANLISGNAANNYYGCCETEFKACFNNLNQSFKYRRKSNTTKLSKAFWQAKDTGKSPAHKMEYRGPYSPISSGGKLLQSMPQRKTYNLAGRCKLNPQQKNGTQWKMSSYEQI